MNTVNHTLWGATIGRVVGLPGEGALIGSMPDLIVVPLFAFSKYHYNSELKKAPTWILRVDYFFHNWFVGIGLVVFLYLLSPVLGILGLAYMWHIVEDAFLHTDLAAPFLYPVWKEKIKVYSAAKNIWVQVVDLLLIYGVNFVILPRPVLSWPVWLIIGLAVMAGIVVGKKG